MRVTDKGSNSRGSIDAVSSGDDGALVVDHAATGVVPGGATTALQRADIRVITVSRIHTIDDALLNFRCACAHTYHKQTNKN